ncbi:hypothetical protein GGU11DRAFT_780552, partial [Lentinula aff. detonsa]
MMACINSRSSDHLLYIHRQDRLAGQICYPHTMILSLRSLCAAFLLWTSCSVIAMPVEVKDTVDQDKTVFFVNLARKLDGKVIDRSIPLKLNPNYSVFQSTGSPSERSPEEWLIEIGLFSWQAEQSPNGLLKAVRIKEAQSSQQALVIGKVVFNSRDHQRRILDDLVNIQPGGKFEYTKQIIEKLKNARVWKKCDGSGYEQFESLYEQV